MNQTSRNRDSIFLVPSAFVLLLFAFVHRGLADEQAPILQIKDWNSSLPDKWSVLDRQHGKHDGTIEFHQDHVRLFDDSDHQPDFAQLVYAHPVNVPEQFAIQFRCRLLRLGLSDQGTGHKSFFQLLMGLSSPSGPFGININLTHDRYNLEANTKVFRSDAEWHTWRMEFDTRNGWTVLYRDGQYIGLHEAHAKQAEGIRLAVVGSSEAPAEVELAEFALIPLSKPAQTVVKSPKPTVTETRDGDWPLWRRDVGNTGQSPLKGNVTSAPEVQWSLPVGSAKAYPFWMDLDGDGAVEALINHKGTLTAWRVDGSQLWSQALEGVAVFGLHDLDDDGQNELVIAAGVPSQVHLLDAKTGQVRYQCPELPMSGVSCVRIARLNLERKGLQAIVWSAMHEVGYCLSFAEGIDKGKMEWTFDWKHRFFHPTAAFADMNRDGVLDLIVVTYSHAFVFDGPSGQKLMELEWNAGRNYGSLAVRDVDADGYPDIVVLAGHLREHLSVLHNEGGKSLKLLWDKFYEQNYPEDFVTLRTLTTGVGDFDRNGRTEIVYSLWDDRVDQHWRTIIVDAMTGAVHAELKDLYVAGIASVEGVRSDFLLLSRPSDRATLNLNQLEAWGNDGQEWKVHSKLPAGTVLFAEQFRDDDLSTWSQERHLLQGAASTPWRPFIDSTGTEPASHRGVFLQPDGTARVEFVTYNSTQGWHSSWKVELPANRSQARDVVRLTKQDQTPAIVVGQNDGPIELISSKGVRAGGIHPHTGANTIPVAARLKSDERLSILFFTPEGELQCYRSDQANQPPKLRWSRPGVGVWSLYTPLSQPQGLPVITDVTSDSGLEVLIAEKPDRLIALNSSGEVLKTWTFPALPQQWLTANLDGDQHPDLVVTYPTGAVIDVDTVAISGANGQTMWKMHCGNGPSAIADVNSDGLDDVVMRDLYERRLLLGTTGHDLQPIEMTAGYHTPLLPHLLTKSSYSGVLWGGGAYSIGFNDAVGQSLWKHWYCPQGTPALAIAANGRSLVGSLTAGQIYQLPDLKALESPDKTLIAHDLLSGQEQWRFPVGATTTGIVSADVNGDGQLEFLIGTANNRLLAISTSSNASQRIVWEKTLPGTPGTPIICDDGTGNGFQILISCADGKLYCFGAGAQR